MIRLLLNVPQEEAQEITSCLVEPQVETYQITGAFHRVADRK